MVLVQNVGAELHAMEADIKFSQTIDIGGATYVLYIHIYIYIYIYITPTVVGVYRDWPGSSPLNLYI